jgi:general secretion pathway protein G
MVAPQEQGPRAEGRGPSQRLVQRLAGALHAPLGRRFSHAARLSLGPAGAVGAGFTLIELIIVLAILSLLLMIAVPRYFSHVERTKEATLKQDLNIMRDAIDKFHGDKGRYPESLDELVTLRYIRGVPIDPITDSVTTWKVVPPPDPETKGAVYDIKSGAEGNSLDGKPYGEW